MKVLIIGSGGMLGYVTFRYLQEQGYHVTGITGHQAIPGIFQLDASNETELRGFLDETSFDAVINCAAVLVKPSEERRSEAVRLNAWLPHFLDEYCAEHGGYLLHVSTDGVFSGISGNYSEDSPSDASSFYGRTKYLGEVHSGHALTVRSGFWGADRNRSGAGLFQWLMCQKNFVAGYTEAVFNGVSNLEFAKFADNALKNHWTGLYHLCAAGPISKYDFLCNLRNVFQKDIRITKDSHVCIDRSLKCTRDDIPYQQKSYDQMLHELKVWLTDQPEFSI